MQRELQNLVKKLERAFAEDTSTWRLGIKMKVNNILFSFIHWYRHCGILPYTYFDRSTGHRQRLLCFLRYAL